MDQNYWENYYKKQAAPVIPSTFAKFVSQNLVEENILMELGCGNGRDSIFFSQNKINVIAIDQSKEEIEKLKNQYNNIIFKCNDFVNDSQIYTPDYNDYIYSRFTLHSINEKEQMIVLKNVYTSLKKGGLFLIEVRSTNDEIFGKGQLVERNAYIYEEHYRRFIDFNEFKEIIQEFGFEIEYAIEDKNLAVYKESNPTLIRMIAKK